MKLKYYLLLTLVVVVLSSCAIEPQKVQTSRNLHKTLTVPLESEGFSFAIFADRTSGNEEEGYLTYDKAIAQVNAMRPDFVFTVGDLIQGYGSQKKWQKEADIFNSTVDRLQMPLYPVAGNHDVYWLRNTKGRPRKHHESDYETYFGPLWYAFEYRNCWFIALFTDEGIPAMRNKNFTTPASQKISNEQLNWLKDTLQKAKSTDHVFIFQHHPRWKGQAYGNDWNRVHDLLVKAGNVSAVFAGHFHNRDYSQKDGIDYYILPTTGGGFSSLSDEHEHFWYWISVKPDKYNAAMLSVDSVIDPKGLSTKAVTVLPRQSWDIRSSDQTIEYEISTTDLGCEKVLIKTMIENAHDESGDKGVTALFLDENKEIIFESVLKNKDQRWFSSTVDAGKVYYMQLKDPDASFEGPNAGNQGKIEIQLVYYPKQ